MKDFLTEARLWRYGLHSHMKVFSNTKPVERFALYSLASFLPRRARALEIGSHIGSSALFICAGLQDRGGHLVCVDTWMNETMPDGRKDTYSEFEKNTRPYRHMITPVRKYSHELRDDEIGGPLDFAFVDGDHSEAAVRSDFNLLAPRMKPGGRIAFHDASITFPGVNIVIGEALASGSWGLVRFDYSLAVIEKLNA